MNKEIQQTKDFEVFTEVPADTTENFNDLWHSAMDTTGVLRWKGSSVRARLCVRGYNQIVQDSDLTFASTPVFFILKVLSTIALAKGWSIYTLDISVAFLHAPLPDDEVIHIRPPVEYYPSGKVLWKLHRAVYGLKTSPRNWQVHFA
jgi:hypothetical protein